MTPGSALACPNCKRVLETHAWHDATAGTCRRCNTDFEFIAFPALTARAAHVAAQAAGLDGDSVCYFHAQNRAESICEECGRLLCPVCVIAFAGKKMCPTCVAATRASEAANVVGYRTLFDGIALTVAGLPLLIWPVTLVTAPVALGVVIYGWNKPGSLVRRRTRVRLVIAAVLALLQIAGWATFFIFLWLR
ncbi:MAG: hypothetical protein Q7S40_28085 [Opitutaceae bacterium]|nr:hypothetical protein [Opitutaceae bacterium]